MDTQIKTIEDVIAVQRQIQAGEEVPLETLRACIEMLREGRKTAMLSKKTKAAGTITKKPALTLDDIF